MRALKEKLKNFIIIHYGTVPRRVLKWTNTLLVLFFIACIIFFVIYFPLILWGRVDVANAFINYIYPLFLPTLVGFVVLVLLIGIWERLLNPKEFASAFLNNAVKEIENLDINDNERKLKILEIISYSQDFVYNASPFVNPYSVPMPLRLKFPPPLWKNKLVFESFRKRRQFILNKLDELTPVIAFSKDKKELERVTEELKRFSVILREGNYLDLEEAELKRSYLPDIFDWKTFTTGVFLIIIAWFFKQ